ncbi:hypothetical protein ABZ897_15875 [Nonomuraea sp. NPDC046802]|uniref:hypothetical protein n=1 Tax=Nonomuraea sp. NPDC046802 TaxID=3154919 RepID=UPI0034108F7C
MSSPDTTPALAAEQDCGISLTIEQHDHVVELDLAVPGIQGPPGPPGPGGGGYHTHVQTTPALVWTIPHPLGRRPAAVAVEDLDGFEIDALVERPTEHLVIIMLGAATAGRAHLS